MDLQTTHFHLNSKADPTGQFLQLALAHSYADSANKMIFFDLRAFFAARKEPAPLLIDKLLRYMQPADSSIIVDTNRIDSFLKDRSVQVNPIPTGLHHDSRASAAHSGPDPTNFDTLKIFSKFHFAPELVEQFAEVKPQLSGRTGVNYQSGNGEIYCEDDNQLQQLYLQNPTALLDSLQSTDDTLFVCSDTKVFLTACKNRFPNRVLTSPAQHLPCGAGSTRYSTNLMSRAKKRENVPFCPARHLAEKFFELYLLGLCTKRVSFDARLKWLYPQNTIVLAPAANQKEFSLNYFSSETDNRSVVHDIPIHFSLIRELVSNPRPVIFEIGCNSGSHTRKFLQTFPAGIFYCFEPEPRALARFKDHIGESSSIRLFDCAIGAEKGVATFYQSAGWPEGADKEVMPEGWDLSGSIRKPKNHLNVFDWCTFNTTLEVPVTTLDAVCTEYGVEEIDFIWMDVQGAEKDVFAGAVKTLERVRWIYTEYGDQELYEGQAGLEKLLEFLPDYKVLLRYKNDVLLWNTRYAFPESDLLKFHLNITLLEGVTGA